MPQGTKEKNSISNKVLHTCQQLLIFLNCCFLSFFSHGKFSFCRSEEKIKHFGQLKSELFLKDNTLRRILCLITELKVAAQKNFILKRLFWKVGVLFLIFKTHFTCLSNVAYSSIKYNRNKYFVF